MNNNYCFSIIFKGECEKPEGNLAKHEYKMSPSLVIITKLGEILCQEIL